MYYEETVIDGVLYCRGLPESEWRPVSYKEILDRMLKAEQEVISRRNMQQQEMIDPASAMKAFSDAANKVADEIIQERHH